MKGLGEGKGGGGAMVCRLPFRVHHQSLVIPHTQREGAMVLSVSWFSNMWGLVFLSIPGLTTNTTPSSKLIMCPKICDVCGITRLLNIDFQSCLLSAKHRRSELELNKL